MAEARIAEDGEEEGEGDDMTLPPTRLFTTRHVGLGIVRSHTCPNTRAHPPHQLRVQIPPLVVPASPPPLYKDIEDPPAYGELFPQEPYGEEVVVLDISDIDHSSDNEHSMQKECSQSKLSCRKDETYDENDKSL